MKTRGRVLYAVTAVATSGVLWWRLGGSLTSDTDYYRDESRARLEIVGSYLGNMATDGCLPPRRFEELRNYLHQIGVTRAQELERDMWSNVPELILVRNNDNFYVFMLRSLGADGVDNSADDIVVEVEVEWPKR